MRRHPGSAGGPVHVETGESRATLPVESDVTRNQAPVDWDEESSFLPYLDAQGHLVVPTRCPKKYRYWADGQSVAQTIKELRGDS